MSLTTSFHPFSCFSLLSVSFHWIEMLYNKSRSVDAMATSQNKIQQCDWCILFKSLSWIFLVIYLKCHIVADLFTPATHESMDQHSTTPINLHPSFNVFLLLFPSSLNNGWSVLCKHSYLIRYGPYPRMAISDPSIGPPSFLFFTTGRWGATQKQAPKCHQSLDLKYMRSMYRFTALWEAHLISKTLLT